MIQYGYSWYRKTDDGYEVSPNAKRWTPIKASDVPYSVRLYFRQNA